MTEESILEKFFIYVFHVYHNYRFKKSNLEWLQRNFSSDELKPNDNIVFSYHVLILSKEYPQDTLESIRLRAVRFMQGLY